jgi:hypothetical protein
LIIDQDPDALRRATDGTHNQTNRRSTSGTLLISESMPAGSRVISLLEFQERKL